MPNLLLAVLIVPSILLWLLIWIPPYGYYPKIWGKLLSVLPLLIILIWFSFYLLMETPIEKTEIVYSKTVDNVDIAISEIAGVINLNSVFNKHIPDNTPIEISQESKWSVGIVNVGIPRIHYRILKVEQ